MKGWLIQMSETNTLQSNIRQLLKGKDETKKQISLVIDSELIRSLDVIAEEFKKLTKGKISSRNQLVELGLSEYVKEASFVLLKDHGVNIEELLVGNENEDEDYNNLPSQTEKMVAVFPAREDGFNQVFLNEHQWYSIRIAEWRIEKIKYVACYRIAPYSEITHYAKVKDIIPFEDSGKYQIKFDGEPIPLTQPIKRGNNDTTNVQSTRYTTLDKLLNAKELWQL
ncbi:hypothetical protein ACFDTO_21285 [Microbacteriaceae bacterium 4G12]